MSLSLIAALTWPGRIIGKDNTIPWRLREDQQRFKALTLGHPVLMGRHTWESLPFKLPGRSNIVLSQTTSLRRSPQGESPDALATSLADGLAMAAGLPGGDKIFCIGGAKLYTAALPHAHALHLTLLHHAFAGDTCFPKIDLRAWRETSRERLHHAGDPSYDYEFLDLQRT
jgi:dihydrofolate reductase